ncbi:mitochondrial transcription termination factor (mTERF) family protein [Nitzschia inconspicua]|uniref:Mitochondrial transcription termination factor (mTERF) family protein n=1 Tax=Nitzschia inconspicua TaxID=303405 RepID=A0A9K3PLH5_9STRA|nr:mitochondrial transcription termination factor (mTERF) family protein [Nitzschia inconspicua]
MRLSQWRIVALLVLEWQLILLLSTTTTVIVSFPIIRILHTGNRGIETYHSASLTLLTARSTSQKKNPEESEESYNVGGEYLFYSPNFYRHVVFENQTTTTPTINNKNKTVQVVDVFPWLDTARNSHPEATILPFSASLPNDTPVIAGGGVGGDEIYNATNTSIVCDDTILHDMTAVLSSLWLCDASVFEKHDAVIQKLDERLGSTLYGRFPPQDRPWIKERILFLLSPLPPSNVTVDINQRCQEFYQHGYGLGLSQRQTCLAIQALRHLLMIHPMEASAKKPPLSFFYRGLQLEYKELDQVRNDLDHWLMGTVSTDAATFAFLRSINVTLDQCEILLQTFSPSLLSFELNPSWELASQKSNGLRSKLLSDSLHLLRMRANVTPPLLHNMLSTHPRLSSYSHHVLQSHMDELQTSLQLPSSDVRKICLRAPSVLGLSCQKIQRNVEFLTQEAGLGLPLLQKVAVADQAILQCTVESNLAPKIAFLKREAGITAADDLNKMLHETPSLFSVSLSKRIEPIIFGFKSIGLTSQDVRSVIVKAPSILTFSWDTILLPKIDFFRERLGYNNSEVRLLLTRMPRILLYNLIRTLAPKIDLLEKAASSNPSMLGSVILDNPSLLLVSMSRLQHRIAQFLESDERFEDFFSNRESRRNKNVVLQRRSKPIFELDVARRDIERTFDRVSDAAKAAGTSTVNMYSIIRAGRPFNGKYYKYGEPSVESPLAVQDQQPILDVQTIRNPPEPEGNDSGTWTVSSRMLRDFSMAATAKDLSSLQKTGVDLSEPRVNGTNACYLAAFVSGRTYPWERSSEAPVKGLAGGAALYFPQFQGPRVQHVMNVVSDYVGLQMIDSSLSPNSDGLIMVEYKFPRPSRNRCSLFVCFEALRIFARLLSLEATKNAYFVDSVVTIDIFTDSTFAWNAIKNSSSLLKWGGLRNKVEFENSPGAPRRYKDILYPLARIYSTLRNQAIFTSFTKKEGRRFAKEICIRFRHTSELGWTGEDPVVRSIGAYAQEAAEKQYAQLSELSRNEIVWKDNARYDVFYF